MRLSQCSLNANTAEADNVNYKAITAQDDSFAAVVGSITSLQKLHITDDHSSSANKKVCSQR